MGLIYYIRSRNTRGIILVLSCYQNRMKNVPHISNKNTTKTTNISSIVSSSTHNNNIQYGIA